MALIVLPQVRLLFYVLILALEKSSIAGLQITDRFGMIPTGLADVAQR
jgi:hypothetical protein